MKNALRFFRFLDKITKPIDIPMVFLVFLWALSFAVGEVVAFVYVLWHNILLLKIFGYSFLATLVWWAIKVAGVYARNEIGE